jgi:hypothetical protein
MVLESRIAFDGRTTRVAQACRKHTKVIMELFAGQTAMQSLHESRRLWFRDCRLRHMGTYRATLY